MENTKQKLARIKQRTITNGDRARRINHVLHFYKVDELAEDFDDSNGKLDLACLVADALHYCDAKGIDFDDVLRLARSHHDEERQA